ncbi:hypothetical protein A946_02085 [Methylacidiphilum kamchatkense Kam1]|uniref:Uncharacterized protein n=1 Tax=Methylacidiphilum kamchatkense Kam1 TaxID=1202785 RepID=A0ABR5A0C2_9BACT|nr:hypothetical protein A946_02085 [Methylacidiphilum kamchatkense Kam1]
MVQLVFGQRVAPVPFIQKVYHKAKKPPQNLKEYQEILNTYDGFCWGFCHKPFPTCKSLLETAQTILKDKFRKKYSAKKKWFSPRFS